MSLRCSFGLGVSLEDVTSLLMSIIHECCNAHADGTQASNLYLRSNFFYLIPYWGKLPDDRRFRRESVSEGVVNISQYLQKRNIVASQRAARD